MFCPSSAILNALMVSSVSPRPFRYAITTESTFGVEHLGLSGRWYDFRLSTGRMSLGSCTPR